MHVLLEVPRAGHFYFLEYERFQDKIEVGKKCSWKDSLSHRFYQGTWRVPLNDKVNGISSVES